MILSILMLLGGLAEAISLGLVVPFLAAMAAPGKILNQPFLQAVFFEPAMRAGLLGASAGKPLLGEHELTGIFAIMFILTALFAGGLRLVLVWASTRLASASGTDLGTEVYLRSLFQPYAVHLSQNSSSLISSLTFKISLTTITLGSFLTLLTSITLGIFLIGALLLISPVTTFVAGGALAFCYGVMTLISHRKLGKNSLVICREHAWVVKSLQEGLGGIRDILLDGTQAWYGELYRKADALLRRANANITIIGQYPRFIMETVGMVVFALIALFLSQGPSGLVSALPVLGALALGVQRLLPALQQGYSAWSTMVAYQQSNQEVVVLLNQPLPPWANQPLPAPLPFRSEIRFEAVKFRYLEKNSWALDRLSFTIPKGSRVGFVGTTGSGKSTCLDLLMGLLEPTEGQILIDGSPLTQKNLRAWQRNIAHVPQAIYLSDSTLAENIAFGVPASKIDMNRVKEAARQAQIADFIESSSQGYQAIVGERGIRLSGGQRQRIGIARALYKQAQVLVFDEATSALDHETEEAVMRSINSLNSDLTILSIAHRTSTLKNCDQIIDLGLSSAAKKVATAPGAKN